MEINKKSGYLKIIVKPNSPKTEITKYENETLHINVHAKPEDNKANIEIIKFLTKKLKKKIVIKSGLKTREKLILIHE